MQLIKNIKRTIANLPGWCTNRKIVVIESDDWGSIRMPSKEVYNYLLKKGIAVDNLSYNRYDTLASEEDLSALFEILLKAKDKNGKPAVITANTIMANPDFGKIKQQRFTEYFYEPFIETFKKYPGREKSFSLWKEGIKQGIFIPQFHGREHLNVNRWMRALRENVGIVRFALDLGMFDLSTSLVIGHNSFMETLNFENYSELTYQIESLEDGLNLFERIFGYRSSTFIAPCYTWSDLLNEPLSKLGIEGFQGSFYQFEPKVGKKHSFKKIFHYTGEKNKYSQLFLVRNAAFEPAGNHQFNWIGDVITKAKTSFRIGKPLIISSHRLNYIGSIVPENRRKNLDLLVELLKRLQDLYPDLEFMSSDELLKLIKGSK
jgi:glycosyltransferase involved in cell wall biosynthesis